MPPVRKSAPNPLDRYRVPILDRTFDLLELLSKHPEGMTLTTMTETLKMPKNSVFRIATTLALRGYVERDEATKIYRASRRLLSLGHAAVGGQRLIQAAGPVLTALRDAENRLMFCGYDPRGFKLFVWVLSAVLCGLAGALYVPQVGIINPSEMSPTNSIEAAVWVALGGRGTLIGPLLGAGVVNGMKSWFTVAFPEYWLFFLGALFIIVTLYLPKGVIGLLKK